MWGRTLQREPFLAPTSQQRWTQTSLPARDTERKESRDNTLNKDISPALEQSANEACGPDSSVSGFEDTCSERLNGVFWVISVTGSELNVYKLGEAEASALDSGARGLLLPG